MHVCILLSIDLIRKINLKTVLYIDIPAILPWNSLK